ncbi:unnamed protein product [Parajaminaea phylloscopi]
MAMSQALSSGHPEIELASAPSNVLCLFQAHFHVRRGNELTYQCGHELDLSGVEWKVLPSGAHAVHNDLIWFLPPGSTDCEDSNSSAKLHKIGIAVFHNRRIEDEDEVEDSAGQLDQRGARMIAVGLIVATESLLPSACLAACLPHVEALQSLTVKSAEDPTNHQILTAFLDARRFDPARDTQDQLRQVHQLRCPSPLSRKAVGPADPLLDLPAIANALGLLLPQLLRKLLVRGTRLLIFSPLGAETASAASIAWALAEILEGALTPEDDGSAVDEDRTHAPSDRGPGSPAGPTAQPSRLDRLPVVRGMLALPDLGQLQDEQRERIAASYDRLAPQGWIAWTADKLYLEKADLYDCLLDLSPAFSSQANISASANAHSPSFLKSCESNTPTAAPLFSIVKRTPSQDRRPATADLKVTAWHPRDFAIYRSNEHRSVRLASRPRTLARRGSRSSVRLHPAQEGEPGGPLEVRKPLLKHYRSEGERAANAKEQVTGTVLLSHLLAFIRYWLSSLWFIPRQWRINLRESYGYVPLSIRTDGGVQAGLMLLPDSDTEDEETSDCEPTSPRRKSQTHTSHGAGTKTTEPQPGTSVNAPAARSRSNTASSSGRVSQTSGKYLALPTPSGGTSRPEEALREFEDSDDSDDDASLEAASPPSHSDIDPLLAACGAHSPAASRRYSRGHHGEDSPGQITKEILLGGAENNNEEDTGGDIDAGHSATDTTPLLRRTSSNASKSYSTGGRRGGSRRLRKSSQQSHRDNRLARAVFTIWTEWLGELVLDIEGLATAEEEQSDSSTGQLPPFTSRQLSELGLNSRNEEDRALVQSLTGREVLIGYWKFWGNWF